MKRRVLFLALAAGFVVLGLAAQDARAGQIILPTTLDTLLPSGNYAVVVGAETLTFSSFTYAASSVPTGSAPRRRASPSAPSRSGTEPGSA